MNDKNILIKFEADASGLQPGEEGLTKLEAKDKALREQVARTTAEIIKRDKAIVEGANLSTKSIEGLSNSLNNISKASIGAALTKSLADIKNQLNLTDKQLQTFYENVKKGAQAKLVDGLNVQEYKTLQTIIAGAENALKALGTEENKTGSKTLSLRTQLRNMREELARMEEAGLDGTAAFEKLQIEAGQLADQLGDTQQRIKALSSDTFIFDALASGVEGVTGAFAAAQGAVALFGSENENLQRAILKVNAALSLLQGIQAVIGVLQKQSAASIAIDLLLRRNQAAATTAQAVAEGELVIATEAQTAATEGAAVATGALNTVMNLNPAVLLITTIAALAGAMYYFSDSEEDARKNTEAVNEALLEQLDIEKELADAVNESIARNNRNLTNKLAYDQAAKKSRQDVLKDELDIATQRVQLADIDRQARSEEINSLDDYFKKYTDAKRRIIELDRQVEIDPSTKQEAENLKKHAQQIADINKKKYDELKGIEDEYFNSHRDLESKRIEIETFANEQTLKSATAYAEARVLLARAGTSQEFAARRALLATQLREELANTDLTEGEKAKIRAKYKKDKETVDREQNIRTLQIAKAGIDDQVILAKEGSKERLDFEIAAIEKQKEIDLAAAGLSEKEKARIRDAARATEREKLKAFNKQVAEDAVNTRIADVNTQLSELELQNVKDTDAKVIALKKQLIEEQARLEIIGIENSEKNEILRAAKIKAVYAKELVDKQQLERQKARAEIEAQLSAQNNPLKLQLDQSNSILQLESLTDEKRRREREKNADKRIKIAENEQLALNRLSLAGLISYKDYQEQMSAVNQKENDARIEKENVAFERRQAIQNAAVQLFQAGVSALTEINNARYQEDLDRNKELYDKKLISEEEYNNRVRSIKRQQAEADKGAALFNIFLSTAQAIAKASPNVILIALAAALGAAQTAAVLAKPLPAFKTGKVGIDGPGTTTSDSILARISKGESIINADMTVKHRAALEAINSNKFQDFLDKMTTPLMMRFSTPISLPSVADTSLPHAQNSSFLAKDVVDGLVSKLPAALASKMPRQPGVHMEFDLKTGMLTIHNEEQKRISYTNRKSRR